MDRAVGSSAGPWRTSPSRLELVWADGGYTDAFARWLDEQRGRRLQVVRHPERRLRRYGLEEKRPHPFRVSPRRRVVERTFARLGHARRSSDDYERLPAVSEAMIHGAMSRPMLRRLTHVAARSPSETACSTTSSHRESRSCARRSTALPAASLPPMSRPCTCPCWS